MIDFTPRGPGLGRKVGFLPGNRMDFTRRCSGLGRKVNFNPNLFAQSHLKLLILICGGCLLVESRHSSVRNIGMMGH